MESPSSHIVSIMIDRIEKLHADGNLNEALHAASALVEKTERELSNQIEQIDAFVNALEIRGNLYREMQQPQEASDDYDQAIEMLQGRRERYPMVGRLHAELGAAYDELDNAKETAKHWQLAIEHFENSDPPELIEVATMANNLAFLYKAQNDFDSAENSFLRALEILHAELGDEHEQTASVFSNLGALYQRAGYNEQSREMHLVALDVRKKIFGEDHPDTAQSHNNLALALLETGDREEAGQHFEQALKTFEALGAEFIYDLDAVATNYCEFLKEEGQGELAGKIDSRISDLLEDAGALAS